MIHSGQLRNNAKVTAFLLFGGFSRLASTDGAGIPPIEVLLRLPVATIGRATQIVS